MAGYWDDLIDSEDAVQVGNGEPTNYVASPDNGDADKSESTIFETLQPQPESTTEQVIENAHPIGEQETVNDSVKAPVSVPSEILTRPTDNSLRARFSGHKVYNDLYRKAWITAIVKDPMAFDAILYRAKGPSDVVIDNDGFEVMEAERLDPNQETLVYDTLEAVKVLDCPDERDSFLSLNNEDDNTGYQDEILMLRVAAFGISIGSIIEWNEELASGEIARRWWYVHRKANYGTAVVGTLYICIPCRAFEESISDGE